MKTTNTGALDQPTVPEIETVVPIWEMSEDDAALVQASLTGTLKEREAEVLAWYRALPRLLGEGEEGRFALIYEGQIVSIWDTRGDAIQAGYEKFGPDRRFWAGEIQQWELENLKRFLVQERAKRCPK